MKTIFNTDSSRAVRKLDRRNDIQLLRGVAVISVLLFHLNKNLFPYGYLGVDIFFVISGFVISNLIYFQLNNKSFSFKYFYFMRFKRIFPALISYSIFVQILSYLTLDHRNIIETGKTLFYSLIFVSNIHLARYLPYFDQGSELNLVINLWSLSVEEQFYIVFPIFAYLIRKYAIKYQILIYISLTFLSIFFMNEAVFDFFKLLKSIFLSYDNYLFYSPFTRVWEFTLGIVGMFLNQKIKKEEQIKVKNYLSTLCLLGLTFVIYFQFDSSSFLRMALANLLVLIILIFKLELKNLKNIIVTFTIFTGNISYSLYLFHQGIIAGVRNHNFYATSASQEYINLNNFYNLSLLILFIYLVSWLNYFFIEERYRKVNEFKSKKFILIFILLIIVISTIILSENTSGYSFRSNELKSFSDVENLTFLSGKNYLTQRNNNCLNRDVLSELCKFGSGDEKLYVIGDSVISTLVSGLVSENSNNRYTIYELTKGGCPLILEKCNLSIDSRRFTELSKIENSKIIIGGRYQKYFQDNIETENNKNLFFSTLNNLESKNNKIYVLSAIPEPLINERMYFFKNKVYPEYEYKKWKDSIKNYEIVLDEIVNNNITKINIESIFCEKGNCKFRNNKSYLFLDHVHLTHDGANFLSKSIYEIINKDN